MITLSAASIALILLAVFLGAILTLSAVALGALVVFRTKREPHESLFKVGAEKGDAFISDDYGPGVEDIPDQRRDLKAEDPNQDIHQKFVDKFLQQYNTRKEAGIE